MLSVSQFLMSLSWQSVYLFVKNTIFVKSFFLQINITDCVITPLPAGPWLINFFKSILVMASDSSSSSDQGYHTIIFRYAMQNRKGGSKRTNTDLGQLRVQEREFCDTPCICRLSWASINHSLFQCMYVCMYLSTLSSPIHICVNRSYLSIYLSIYHSLFQCMYVCMYVCISLSIYLL